MNTRRSNKENNSHSVKCRFGKRGFLCKAFILLVAFIFLTQQMCTADIYRGNISENIIKKLIAEEQIIQFSHIIPEDSIIKPVGVFPIAEKVFNLGKEIHRWLKSTVKSLRNKVIAASGLVIPIDIDKVSPEFKDQLEGLSASGKQLEGGFTIEVPRALDIAVCYKSGHVPTRIPLPEEKNPFLQPSIHVTDKGDVQLQFSRLRVKREFEKNILTLKNGTRRRLPKDIDTLTIVLVGWYRHAPSGFTFNVRTKALIGEAIATIILKGERQLLIDKLAGLVGDSHLAGEIAEKAESELTDLSVADLRRTRFGEAKRLKKVLMSELAERALLPAAHKTLTATPAPLEGALLPASGFLFQLDPAKLILENTEKVRGVIELAKREAPEEARNIFMEKMTKAETASLEQAEAIAVLLKEAQVLKTDIGIIINARDGAFNPSKIAEAINGISEASSLKPFILIDKQEVLSDLVIAGVSTDRIIIAREGKELTVRAKAHIAYQDKKIIPSHMVFVLPLGEESIGIVKRYYSDMARPENLGNFVITEDSRKTSEQYAVLLYASVILVARRLADKEKPSIMIIAENGSAPVEDLGKGIIDKLNVVLEKPQDIRETAENLQSNHKSLH